MPHEYKVIRDIPENVEIRVNQLLNLDIGWKPQGGPLMQSTQHTDYMIQAMIKLDIRTPPN